MRHPASTAGQEAPPSLDPDIGSLGPGGGALTAQAPGATVLPELAPWLSSVRFVDVRTCRCTDTRSPHVQLDFKRFAL